MRTLGIYPGSNCPDPLTCSTGLVDVADLLFQSGSQSFSRSFAWSVTDPHPLIGHMLVVSGSAPTPDFVTSGAFPTYVCLNPGDGDFLSIPADPLNPCPQNGTLISTLISDFPFDGGRADVEVADLNLDGFNDIITADTGATRGAQFCLNDGNEPPFFNCAQVSGAGIASSSVEVGDFDGVNGPDIIVDSSLCLNDGSASFSTACTAIAGVTSFVSGAGQLNNDALPDITSTGGQTCINNGGAVPTFTCSAGGATGTSSTFADVNGDSFIDIVAANGNVCLSDGAAAPAFTCTSVNTTFGQAAVGHINDDNYPDLAFSGSAEFCINSGPPTFTFACSPAGAPAGNGVGIADFDSDAYGDLVFNRPGGITTCLNDGAGSFPACNSVVGSPTGANGPLAIAELGQGAPPNPVPMLLSLSRTFGTVGETPFTLTLTGLDFVPGAIVTFNGVAQTTTFVNSTTLTVEFTGALLAVSQVFQIEVANPTPGGGPAPTPRFFTVNPPAPTITSLSMPVSTVGAPPFTQTVTGTNFDASSVVRFDGVAQPTTFVSPTQVTVQITATELAAPGTVAITVFNPASGLSNASTFMVNAPAVPIIVTGVPDNTTAGDGVCTLREAINNANSNSDTTGGDCAAGSGSDTINLPAGTYALAIAGADEDANATGDFDFTDAAATSIIGAGERTTILDGGGIDRLFDIFGAGLVTIEKVSLINGAVSGANARGAAVRANVGADLAMSVCSVRNNSTGAGSNTDGGAVSLEPGGTVTGAIDRCTFVGNSAMGHAGAIMNFGPGALTVTNSTLTGNTANGRGAAIESVGPATIDFSTITNNTAGAGEAAVSSHGASPGTVTISKLDHRRPSRGYERLPKRLRRSARVGRLQHREWHDLRLRSDQRPAKRLGRGACPRCASQQWRANRHARPDGRQRRPRRDPECNQRLWNHGDPRPAGRGKAGFGRLRYRGFRGNTWQPRTDTDVTCPNHGHGRRCSGYARRHRHRLHRQLIGVVRRRSPPNDIYQLDNADCRDHGGRSSRGSSRFGDGRDPRARRGSFGPSRLHGQPRRHPSSHSDLIEHADEYRWRRSIYAHGSRR